MAEGITTMTTDRPDRGIVYAVGAAVLFFWVPAFVLWLLWDKAKGGPLGPPSADN